MLVLFQPGPTPAEDFEVYLGLIPCFVPLRSASGHIAPTTQQHALPPLFVNALVHIPIVHQVSHCTNSCYLLLLNCSIQRHEVHVRLPLASGSLRPWFLAAATACNFSSCVVFHRRVVIGVISQTICDEIIYGDGYSYRWCLQQ